jgi:hypothetical protein
MMYDGTRVIRRPRRAWPPTARIAAAIAAATAIAACGSNSPRSSSSGGHPTPANAQQEALNFSRCMRSHGVSSFPDPTATGGVNLNVPGINPSSPSFRFAQTACQHLLPVKSPPSGPPSARARARLIQLATCMRAHGISLPDPKPDPLPPPNSAPQYGTLYGEGGYWIGIPNSINAHSPAFIQTLRACHGQP